MMWKENIFTSDVIKYKIDRQREYVGKINMHALKYYTRVLAYLPFN